LNQCSYSNGAQGCEFRRLDSEIQRSELGNNVK
jgi:hypothetical protein